MRTLEKLCYSVCLLLLYPLISISSLLRTYTTIPLNLLLWSGHFGPSHNTSATSMSAELDVVPPIREGCLKNTCNYWNIPVRKQQSWIYVKKCTIYSTVNTYIAVTACWGALHLPVSDLFSNSAYSLWMLQSAVNSEASVYFQRMQ